MFCDNVELGRVPEELNNTKVHTLTLRSNNLRSLDEYAFHNTGEEKEGMTSEGYRDAYIHSSWGNTV